MIGIIHLLARGFILGKSNLSDFAHTLSFSVNLLSELSFVCKDNITYNGQWITDVNSPKAEYSLNLSFNVVNTDCGMTHCALLLNINIRVAMRREHSYYVNKTKHHISFRYKLYLFRPYYCDKYLKMITDNVKVNKSKLYSLRYRGAQSFCTFVKSRIKQPGWGW